jgi:UDP-N-acetylmuramate dehydrogenase
MLFSENYPLDHLNTFGIKVNANFYAEAFSVEDIKEALAFKEQHNLQLFILGGGSNVLFANDFHGLVLRIVSKGVNIVEETTSHVIAEAQAGEVWHDFVNYTINNGWGGVENLSLIPGTVGASPIQNIGAYGTEIKDTCTSVTFLDLSSLELKTFTNEECQFGYRDSIFKREGKEKYIITAVSFRLNKNPQVNISYGQIKDFLLSKGVVDPTIKDVGNAVSDIRKSKLPDPSKIGNAGSFFKNPTIPKVLYTSLQATYPNIPSYPVNDNSVKVPAGWLIDQRGWKGKSFGNAGVHEHQALVLVNKSNASGSEILTLAHQIQRDILQIFGISLEIEVNIIS